MLIVSLEITQKFQVIFLSNFLRKINFPEIKIKICNFILKEKSKKKQSQYCFYKILKYRIVKIICRFLAEVLLYPN